MDILIAFAFGAILALAFVAFGILAPLAGAVIRAERAMARAPAESSSRPAKADPLPHPGQTGEAAGAAANDDARGVRDGELFSDLVPSMGRTAANDPGPEGYPTRFPRPCRACEKARALALSALHRAGVRRAYTHTH